MKHIFLNLMHIPYLVFIFLLRAQDVEPLVTDSSVSGNLTLGICLHVEDFISTGEIVPLERRLNPYEYLVDKITFKKNIDDSSPLFSVGKYPDAKSGRRAKAGRQTKGFGDKTPNCGYKSCPKTKEGMVNIHLVPHSHDDVGWLKTVEQYYRGEKNEIQDAEIRKIITNVVQELTLDPSRRFIQVETAFFWRWWQEVNQTQKDTARKLIESGQLEFISGGWSMNDEATAHYNAIIDQFTLGLRFLNDTFGQCGVPRIAWQIDPFGHSREQAAMSAALGFDALFFARLHYQDFQKRKKEAEMELLWSADDKNLGKDAWLFTHVFFNHYQYPEGFCFDTYFCSDSPIPKHNGTNSPGEETKYLQPDEITDKNLKGKLEDFENAAENWKNSYTTNHILMPMGSDFHYQNAKYWYDNLDKLIKGINEKQSSGGKLNLLYSTPSCYIQEVNKAGVTFPVKTDDFYPYESERTNTWAGYFTSRPTFKFFAHSASNFLQACKQLGAMTTEGADDAEVKELVDDVFVLDEALGVVQHHDGVTGTSKQPVHDDYSLSMHKGVLSCQKVIQNSLQKLEGPDNEYSFCPLLNISSCPETENAKDGFVVNVYNPLSLEVDHAYLRLPVTGEFGSGWKIEGATGETGIIKGQVVPIPDPVLQIPGREGSATDELVFPAGRLPGLTVTNFKLTWTSKAEGGSRKKRQFGQKKEDVVIKNSVGLELTIDGETGLPKKLKSGDSETDLAQNFYYYRSGSGTSGTRPSGAYIFKAEDQEVHSFKETPTFQVYEGDHLTEVHVTVSNWSSQVIRVYDKSPMVEFEWLGGPIPKEGAGLELIMKFTSNLNNNKIFYTDSNGRQLIRRERDHQDTFEYDVSEKISGNYYPINSRIIITEGETLEENKRTLILFNDRSQGGSSINDGEIEIMLHRRCTYDDALGVGEPLNEQAFGSPLVARGKIWLLFAGDQTGLPVSIHRSLAQEILRFPILAFRKARSSEQFTVAPNYSKLAELLPQNCHLLTLQKLSKDQLLIRFEHFYEKGEDAELSQNTTISYQKLQQVLNFKSMRETSLGANQWKDELTRLEWKPKEGSTLNKEALPHFGTTPSQETDISLMPFQIRTFILTL